MTQGMTGVAQAVTDTVQDRRSILLALGSTILTAACDRAPQQAENAVPASWPRTIEGAAGAVRLPRPPRRVVSTSVTLTGTLLAIGAPVVASAATQAQTGVADAQGFFTQWATVARNRGVTPLYTGEPDSEAIAAFAPDLILVAATGGDSALRIVDQIGRIAPTLVCDYGNKSWQDVAALLGRATGREAAAGQLIADFDREVAATARAIRLPPQPVTAMVAYEDGSGANIWTPASAQGELLTALGFTLAKVPPHVRAGQAMGQRHDVLQIRGEQFAEALSGQTLLLFAADATAVAQLRANRFLAHVPAITAGRVYGMGSDTFRLDYYSARAMLARIRTAFGDI